MITDDVHIAALKDPLHEENFHRIKFLLTSKDGIPYHQFKKTLKPLYTKIKIDLLKGWIVLLLIFSIGIIVIPYLHSLTSLILTTLIISLAGGYVIAYLINFFHEAAHFNINADKRKNEKYANAFVGLLIGQSIQSYRLIHWEHHKNLGTVSDSERSYFESPGIKFLVASVTGIRVAKLIFFRKNILDQDTEKMTSDIKSSARKMLLLSILFHGIIISSMAFFGQWWLIASWILSVGCWYPLFGSSRQVLEHRDEHANKKNDYSKQPHGKLSRIFGNSLFDKSFGSAGFNKHLLHHLEPQISYTRLDDLESFLRETIIGKQLQEKRTGYFKTFSKLFNR